MKNKQNKYEKLFDEFLDFIEVELIKLNENLFKVRDLQEANLGDVESDEFKNATQLIDRLDSYIEDYIIRSVEERLDEIGKYIANIPYEDILRDGRKYLPNSNNDWDLDVIDMICYHFNDIDLNNLTWIKEE